MSRSVRLLACLLLAASMAPAVAAPAVTPLNPGAVLAASPRSDWAAVDPADLLVIDLANGSRVVIALADTFAPVHVANIRALAHQHWYDGLAIERVQDDYVTQWGDPDGKKSLPSDIAHTPPAEYERASAGLSFRASPYRDTYAPTVGVVSAFPVAEQAADAWLVHCYGMVGVGRDLNPDTGSGAELYAVIGQSPRALDRNIALVGRVVSGMEALASLPRGKGDLGFYTDPAKRLPIRQVRLGSELPLEARPVMERLRPESATYAAWLEAKAKRQDSFFLRPANAVDLCNGMPPVRLTTP